MNKQLVLVIGLFLLGGVSQSRGDGFIIVERPIYVPPTHFPFAPLEVTSHQVNVKIEDQLAITSIDQEFYNPNDQRLEGFYMFPVPKGAHIDKFSMEIGGKTVDAELLPADKARGIYEDIVRKMRDPALLGFAGRDLFKVRNMPGAMRLKCASFRSSRAVASPSKFPTPNCFTPTPGRSVISTR